MKLRLEKWDGSFVQKGSKGEKSIPSKNNASVLKTKIATFAQIFLLLYFIIKICKYFKQHWSSLKSLKRFILTSLISFNTNFSCTINLTSYSQW